MGFNSKPQAMLLLMYCWQYLFRWFNCYNYINKHYVYIIK